jgi:hypothetical protein
MFAQKGVELVQELERAKDFLPPFNVYSTIEIIFSYSLFLIVYLLLFTGRWSSANLGRDEGFIRRKPTGCVIFHY